MEKYIFDGICIKREYKRQLIHISGFLFAILAQITGGLLISFYSFMIAAFFFIYSMYLRLEERRINAFLRRIEELEKKLRTMTFHVAREEERKASFFHGPFWFFLSYGLVFLIFPLPVASAAAVILAVGDAFSTLIGSRYGKRKISGEKTLEGSIAFAVSSFIAASLFINPAIAIAGALSGAAAELCRKVNDNISVPLAAAIAMYIAAVVLGADFYGAACVIIRP